VAPISSERRTVHPSVYPFVRPSVHPFVCPSVRPSVCSCRLLHSSFVASARSYPSASLRNANAFCFSFTTLSTPEGERARDSFNNPAARSEIYYFRATLLDKSIWLTPSPPPVAPVTPIVPRRFFSFSSGCLCRVRSSCRLANFCTGWPDKVGTHFWTTWALGKILYSRLPMSQ